MTQDEQTYYLHYDQVGSLRVVSNQQHQIVKEIVYDTYGNILKDTNQSITIPFGFAGGLHDKDTNLVHFGYRDYDSQRGKWTAKDPIGFSGGDTNLYGYVLGDPVNFVDPEGLWVPQVIGAVIGGGYAAYQNWDNSSGWNLAGKIVMGTLTGAWGGFGKNMIGAIARGGLANAANNTYQQLGNDCQAFNTQSLAKYTLYGAVGGGSGNIIGKVGYLVYRPV